MFRQVAARAVAFIEDASIWMVAILVMGAALTTYVATRLFTTYENATQIAILRQELERHKKESADFEQKTVAHFADFERTVYGSLEEIKDAKAAAPIVIRRPTSLEQWMLNLANDLKQQNAALRRQVDAIERRVYQLER